MGIYLHLAWPFMRGNAELMAGNDFSLEMYIILTANVFLSSARSAMQPATSMC